MSDIPQNSNDSKDLINLKDLIQIIKVEIDYLKSLWILIVLLCLGVGIYGYINAYLEKPVYTATFTYALEEEKNEGSLGGALGLASSFGIDVGASAGGAFGGGNLMELMHSRSLIEKTLLSNVTVKGEKISLADFYLRINKTNSNAEDTMLFRTVFQGGVPDRSGFTRTQDSILGVVSNSIDKNQLSISVKDKKLSIGMIEVKSTNELFAKLFCETLVKEVSDFYINTKSKKMKINVEILERQTDSIRAELNSAITGVAIANDNTYNLNPAFNVRKTPSVTRQIDVQANTAILSQLVANLEMAKVALRKETPLFQEIDRPIFPLNKYKPSKVKAFLTFTSSTFLFLIIILLGIRWIKKVTN